MSSSPQFVFLGVAVRQGTYHTLLVEQADRGVCVFVFSLCAEAPAGTCLGVCVCDGECEHVFFVVITLWQHTHWPCWDRYTALRCRSRFGWGFDNRWKSMRSPYKDSCAYMCLSVCIQACTYTQANLSNQWEVICQKRHNHLIKQAAAYSYCCVLVTFSCVKCCDCYLSISLMIHTTAGLKTVHTACFWSIVFTKLQLSPNKGWSATVIMIKEWFCFSLSELAQI